MMTWVWEPVAWSVVLEALRQTVHAAGILDFFDVLAATLVIYAAIRWIHRTRAIRVLQGILIIGVLYMAARQTGLVLTSSVFRGLLTLVTISIVSLFQEDLRHLFERMTVYRHDTMQRRIFRALLRSVRHFAKHHIGALIVLKKNDPLERHTDGGQVLNGRVSSPLLESLFDPHSDGHDGAAIIDGDTITRFGVHLPLSRNLDHDSGLGTRHAAALGLSETTDAFCLVVSETRGTVMIAHDGKLLNMGSGRRLERRLADVLRDRFQGPAGRAAWNVELREHIAEKLLSIALGIVLWLVFVKGIYPAEAVLSVPVRPARIPAGYRVSTLAPAQATLVLRGLQRDLRAVSPTAAVDLEIPKVPRKIQNLTLTSSMVHVSTHLYVAAISPGTVTVGVEFPKPGKRAARPKPRHHSWFSLQ